MREKPVVIRCEFSDEGKNILYILEESFRLYLNCTFALGGEKAYHNVDEWPLISGGQICF